MGREKFPCDTNKLRSTWLRLRSSQDIEWPLRCTDNNHDNNKEAKFWNDWLFDQWIFDQNKWHFSPAWFYIAYFSAFPSTPWPMCACFTFSNCAQICATLSSNIVYRHRSRDSFTSAHIFHFQSFRYAKKGVNKQGTRDSESKIMGCKTSGGPCRLYRTEQGLQGIVLAGIGKSSLTSCRLFAFLSDTQSRRCSMPKAISNVGLIRPPNMRSTSCFFCLKSSKW